MLHHLWAAIYTKVIKPPYKEKRLNQLSDLHYVPVYLAIIVTVCWILLCTTYFYATLQPEYEGKRNFTFFTSFYFTMATFMTIGSGEFAPIVYQLIFPNLVCILIGLSLLALCINIIQRKIESIVNNLVDKIDGNYTEETHDSGKTVIGKKKIIKNEEMLKNNFSSHQPKAVQTNLHEPKPDLKSESILLMVEEGCQANLDRTNCYKKWAVNQKRKKIKSTSKEKVTMKK